MLKINTNNTTFAAPEKLNEAVSRFTRHHVTLSDPLFTEENLARMKTIISQRIFPNPTKLLTQDTEFPRSVLILPSTEGGQLKVLALLTKTKKCGDELLGHGAQSKAKTALDLCSVEVLVVISTNLGQSPDHVTRFLLHVDALKSCQSPCVVPFRGSYLEFDTSDKPLKGLIVTEHCGRDLLRTTSDYDISDKVKSQIIHQLIQAVVTVHSRGYTHADIKPENVMLDSGLPWTYLADFGYAAKDFQKACGTPVYLAPELTQKGVLPSPTTDLWSLGCTIYELLTGKQFSGYLPDPLMISLRSLAQKPVENQLQCNARIEKHIPNEHRPLLLSLLQIDPTKRHIPGEYVSRQLST